MMHVFLRANQADLLARCKVKVAQRTAPKSAAADLDRGIPLFLLQLIETLEVEQTAAPMRSRGISGAAGGTAASSAIALAAGRHGRELLKNGYTIDQVVHDYGDICQSITDLAFEYNEPFATDEFRTLNRCLDNAIADAVREFSTQRDALADQSLNERLGFVAHELRNHITTATLALSAIKSGHVGLTGATGAILDRSLVALTNLIDRSLSEVRLNAGVPVEPRLFSLADFIAEVRVAAALEAQVKKCAFNVSDVDPQMAVHGDWDLLSSAVGNLLQNAFKFTHHKTAVSLRAYCAGDRIRIEVEDHCGGLPPGDAANMFLPFTQGNNDKSGLGLGLSIVQRSVEANNGSISVRDIPGSGCVFTIDLPYHTMPAPSSRLVAA